MFIASYLLLRHQRGRNSASQTTQTCAHALSPVRVERRCRRVRVCLCGEGVFVTSVPGTLVCSYVVLSLPFPSSPDTGPASVFSSLCMLSWLNSCSTETNYNEARLVGRESAMFSFLRPFRRPFYRLLHPRRNPATAPLSLRNRRRYADDRTPAIAQPALYRHGIPFKRKSIELFEESS